MMKRLAGFVLAVTVLISANAGAFPGVDPSSEKLLVFSAEPSAVECAEPEPGPGLSWYCVIDKPKFYYIGMGHCREEALEQSLLACADSEDVCRAEEAVCEKFEER